MNDGSQKVSSNDITPFHYNGDSEENSQLVRTPNRSLEAPTKLARLDDAECSRQSITDTILSKRQQIHKEMQPGYSPSPTQSRLDTHNRIAHRQRAEKRHKRVDQARGGLEKMEQFVMNGEHLQELQRLSLQAQENALTVDCALLLEQEAQEDLEDDELIEYIEQQEQTEVELDKLLSELSLV